MASSDKKVEAMLLEYLTGKLGKKSAAAIVQLINGVGELTHGAMRRSRSPDNVVDEDDEGESEVETDELEDDDAVASDDDEVTEDDEGEGETDELEDDDAEAGDDDEVTEDDEEVEEAPARRATSKKPQAKPSKRQSLEDMADEDDELVEDAPEDEPEESAFTFEDLKLSEKAVARSIEAFKADFPDAIKLRSLLKSTYNVDLSSANKKSQIYELAARCGVARTALTKKPLPALEKMAKGLGLKLDYSPARLKKVEKEGKNNTERKAMLCARAIVAHALHGSLG